MTEELTTFAERIAMAHGVTVAEVEAWILAVKREYPDALPDGQTWEALMREKIPCTAAAKRFGRCS